MPVTLEVTGTWWRQGARRKARGRVVNEPALIAALQNGQIAGAGLDCMWQEPLPADSPLWDMENVIITPHSAGETRQYEANVIDILLENLARLWRGESSLYKSFSIQKRARTTRHPCMARHACVPPKERARRMSIVAIWAAH